MLTSHSARRRPLVFGPSFDSLRYARRRCESYRLGDLAEHLQLPEDPLTVPSMTSGRPFTCSPLGSARRSRVVRQQLLQRFAPHSSAFATP